MWVSWGGEIGGEKKKEGRVLTVLGEEI